MNNENFTVLLRAAEQQEVPQRLLFVFVDTELPDEHNSEEAQRFHAGQGGALKPIMYVDKALHELKRFSDLVTESQQVGQSWQIVFVGALSGRNGQSPTSQEAQAALDMMVKSVQQGAVSKFLAFDKKGDPVQFV